MSTYEDGYRVFCWRKQKKSRRLVSAHSLCGQSERGEKFYSSLQKFSTTIENEFAIRRYKIIYAEIFQQGAFFVIQRIIRAIDSIVAEFKFII